MIVSRLFHLASARWMNSAIGYETTSVNAVMNTLNPIERATRPR